VSSRGTGIMGSSQKAVEVVTKAIRGLQGETTGRLIVVALDGRSGAGKSTLAAALAGAVDATTVHVDDFYRDIPEADRLELSPAQGVDRYFDWERLREEALMPLLQRQRARFRCFDWIAGGGLSTPITVEPRGIVIVEGVYSARREFDDLLDLTVLVEIANEERELRRPRSVAP
jgi:uridine kinase